MKKIWFIALIFVNCSAFAIPFQGNKCSHLEKGITHPKNGQAVIFDEDCTTAYVLPPSRGRVRVANLAKNANLNFCPGVLQAPKTVSSITLSAGFIADKIEKMIKDFDPASKEIEALKEERAALSGDLDSVREELKHLEARSEEISDQLVALKKKLKTAEDLGDSVDSIHHEVSETKKEYKFQVEKYESCFERKRDLEKRNRNLTAKINLKTKDLAENTTPLFDLYHRLEEIRSTMMDFYKEYAPLNALTAQAVYEVNWADILNEYKKENEHANVSFTSVPITSAKVYAAAHLGSNTSLPVLLSAIIPGQKEDAAAIPEGSSEPMQSVQKYEFNHGTGISVLSAGNGSFSGQIVLSALGACPYYPEGLSTKRDNISHEEISAHLVVNAQYNYPIKLRRKYYAKYNLKQLMSRMEKKGNKRGFFSSTNFHEVLDDNRSEDWLTIEFDSNDAEFAYSKEEQKEITNEVKKDLIDRVLKQVAFLGGDKGMQMPSLPELPKDNEMGSVAVAARVGCPGWLFWHGCYSGGYFLGVVNSIFGKKEAVSKFKHTNDFWAEDNVNQVAVVERVANVTFSKAE